MLSRIIVNVSELKIESQLIGNVDDWSNEKARPFANKNISFGNTLQLFPYIFGTLL